MALAFTGEIAQASWLRDEVGDFEDGVAALLPRRFEHFVRILHPAFTEDGSQVGWSEIADWAGREMHPLAQFKHLSKPRSGHGTSPRPWYFEPNDGDPPQEVLVPLERALRRHTETPNRCWFCLWDGWGFGGGGVQIGLSLDSRETPEEAIERLGFWTGPTFPPEVMSLPRVETPGRDYFLLSGPLSAIVEEVTVGATEEGHPGIDLVSQPPSLFWPEDKRWCVAGDVDLNSTYVAGSAGLIEELLSGPDLEAWPATRRDRIDWGADEVNAD